MPYKKIQVSFRIGQSPETNVLRWNWPQGEQFTKTKIPQKLPFSAPSPAK